MSVSSIFATFFTGYAALTMFFYAVSLVFPKAGFVARGLASYISLMFAALYGVFVSIFLTLIGKQGISQWAAGRIFKYAMLLTAGVEFVIEDPNNVLDTTRPAVFIGNHQTELDVLMLGTMFPKYCSVTAKASLKKTPVLGWFMALSGSIFIDRKNTKDAREAMKGAANEIQSKRQSVYMFPEGTRSYAKEPMLLPFKKGAFHLAVQAGVPIVPCVVANYSHVLFIKSFVFRSGKIPIKVLEPIPTKGLEAADVDELTRTTRELMLDELVSLTAKVRGQPIAMPATNGNSTGKSSSVDTNGAAH
ncbi:hypothetical protein BHE90_009609 [Fusarium euwallaceae]|uniref:1-acyl-sn-glycerol-3-phosphate acyltransferase n=2 Tax=Fusarium solani species complex TaxID=232080 RepID=A0A428TM57_9HYPO|nr:hypothetical protein CEP52_007587 [Fusarium oligoseptatum]RTE75937.1 hypothetical protein BHE90_009609 [Fusarium euwallaceae]